MDNRNVKFLLLLLVATITPCVNAYHNSLRQTGYKTKIPEFDRSQYQPLEKQVKFLQDLDRASGAVKVEVVGNTSIPGKTVGHDIHLVTIGKDKAPILFFDCNIHAREWISSATCHYLIEKLADVFQNDPKKLGGALTSFQWQFMPMLNPDGYEYSHRGPEDKYRLWRKNRRPAETLERKHRESADCSRSGDCIGVDLNRNFPGGWGLGAPEFVNSSKFPWSNFYKGPKPLSEPESQTLHSHIEANKDRILSAISIHSYGKVIVIPKGWLPHDDPDQMNDVDKKRMDGLANVMAKPLGFDIGHVDEVFSYSDLAGGATDDYYFFSQKLDYAFTLELNPEDSSSGGFKLPPELIVPVSDNAWKSLKKMAQYLKRELDNQNYRNSRRVCRFTDKSKHCPRFKRACGSKKFGRRVRRICPKTCHCDTI